MTATRQTTLQWRAAFAAALLITIGAFLGVCVDRLWLVAFSEDAQQQQVSVETLSTALNLNMRQRDEIRALVDSIGFAISDALEQHPESLAFVARDARARLESALPPDQRPRFRNWMNGRRAEMLDRMRRHGRMRGGRGRGRGGPPPPPR
jgi:hypothetical protein